MNRESIPSSGDNPPRCHSERVKPTMLLSIGGVWVSANVYLASIYVEVLRAARDPLGLAIAILIVAWVGLSLCYASYHLLSFIFSLLARHKEVPTPSRKLAEPPKVAILYTCKHDMNSDALYSCIMQTYPDFHVFVLDDSTTPAERRLVDEACEPLGERVTVIRRHGGAALKASNLNHALPLLGAYKYFAVVDADEKIPASFLQQTVALAEGDETIGFVQANHFVYGETNFGRQAGGGFSPHWSYFLPARNHYGFVYFYGHGALLRTEAVRKCGGFPEIVAEDLGITAALRQAGYRGYFAHHVLCLEESPASYARLRRRTGKIVAGTLEFLRKMWPSFIRSPMVSVTEKVDLLLASSVVFLPSVFLAYVVALHGLIGLAVWQGVRGGTNVWEVLEPLNRFDVAGIALATMFAPAIYLAPAMLRHPLRCILYLARLCTIHLSMCALSSAVALRTLKTQKASFVPTGDRSLSERRGATVWLEAVLGVGLCALGTVVGSLPLLAVAVSLAVIPALLRKDLEGPVRVVVFVPLVLGVVGALVSPAAGIAATGLAASAVIAHH